MEGSVGDGAQAVAAQFSAISALTMTPDGALLIADSTAHRVRKVTGSLPGLGASDVVIPRPDRSEIDIFDARGRHLRTLNLLTNAVLYDFGYDSAGRLETLTDFDGNVTMVERTAQGEPTAIVAPFGQRTSIALNAAGYLASVSDPLNQQVLLGYGVDGLLTSKEDARGNLHEYEYEADGRLKKDSDPAGGFKTLARVETGNGGYTVTKATALGRTTAYAMSFPNGTITRSITQPTGLVGTDTTAADGTTTAIATDGTRQVSSMVSGARFGLLDPSSSTQTITPSGLTSTAVQSNSVVLTDPNDPLSLVSQTETTVVNSRTTTTAFDAPSQTFTTTTPAGRRTIRTIDGKGRTTRVQVGDLTPVDITYDVHGRVATVTQGTRSSSNNYAAGGPAAGYLAGTTDPLTQTTTYTRDALGRVLTKTLGGAMTGMTWDSSGNLQSVTPPGQPTHTLLYTPVDLMSQYAPPAAGLPVSATGYSYDVDRALKTVTRPDGGLIGLSYDNAGRLLTTTIPGAAMTRQYYPASPPAGGAPGELSSITGPYSVNLGSTYDGRLRKGTTWSGTVLGSVTWNFDSDFAPSRETVSGRSGTASVVFGYDLDKLLACASPTTCTPAGADALALTRSPQNGLTTHVKLRSVNEVLTYNSVGELATQNATFGSTALVSVVYDTAARPRDALGRITRKHEVISGIETVFDYQYDARNRLSDVLVAGAPSEHYEYDANGNRLSVTTPTGTTSATYDAQDRLLTHGTFTYTYTANGELETKTNTAPPETTLYAYDVLGNLLTVSLPNGTLIEYLVDGLGRRVGKKVNGTLVKQWLYADQLRPVAELDGAGNLVSEFVYGSKPNIPDFMLRGGVQYRIVSDHLGSLRLVVNATTGAVAQRMRHDAWGKVLEDTSPGFVPLDLPAGCMMRRLGSCGLGRGIMIPASGGG